VITFVGAMIVLYSTGFMWGDDGYSRFFAYMNLFVAMMLTLVLAGDLLLLYLGWEGVGLCSFLLIGFWYKDPANARAARKAFIVTRLGDTAFAIGLFLLFTRLGTLDVQEVLSRAAAQWPVGSTLAVAAALLLLGGAIGKSAQLPLQTWLPDAMAGPTPVSALIHAATMVTAGVYLIARMHVLYRLAPQVQLLVGIVGGATLVYAGLSALTQTDLKRALAYSTISQIGYMFLALGVGAWSAGIFHFVTHAFFKSLLFLAAGVIIQRLHEEHDIFRMGGLRRRMPLVFWTFLAGAASLAALPLVTAGYYSKDLILSEAWSSNKLLWSAGVLGAFITALYSFRLVGVIFFGQEKTAPRGRTPAVMALPLVVLAVLAVAAGFVNVPPLLGGWPGLTRLLEWTLPSAGIHHDVAAEIGSSLAVALTTLAGVAVAWLVYVRKPAWSEAMARPPLRRLVWRWWNAGWGFDWLYDRLFVRPFVGLARLNRDDFIDSFFDSVAWTSRQTHRALSLTQNGQLRWYAMVMALGAILALGAAIFI
jgi:NADH-quinone oxidoreductase subunit L